VLKVSWISRHHYCKDFTQLLLWVWCLRFLEHSRFSNNNTTTTVLRPFVRDYPGEPVPEETLTHPPSWSSSNLYQLLPSTTIHSILLVQITCLAIFFCTTSCHVLFAPSNGAAPCLGLAAHRFFSKICNL